MCLTALAANSLSSVLFNRTVDFFLVLDEEVEEELSASDEDEDE